MTNGHHERTGSVPRAQVLPSAEELADSVRTLGLPADPVSSKSARRFVVAALDEWGRAELCDDAAVCTAELATNAILHSRGHFTVAVRLTARGARVDLLDPRPDRLPVTVPESLEPLDTGTTGRGLKMIAALAERWGYFTTEMAKTVWVELSASRPAVPSTEPVVELIERLGQSSGTEVALVDVPVHVAIASGVQVDELVRIVQVYRRDLSAEDRALFADLLERSARPRLVGRQAAFRAAAAGQDTYRIVLAATPSELVAVAEFSVLLERLAADPRLPAMGVGEEVLAMRAWINSEVAAQASGAAPTPYPGS